MSIWNHCYKFAGERVLPIDLIIFRGSVP